MAKLSYHMKIAYHGTLMACNVCGLGDILLFRWKCMCKVWIRSWLMCTQRRSVWWFFFFFFGSVNHSEFVVENSINVIVFLKHDVHWEKSIGTFLNKASCMCTARNRIATQYKVWQTANVQALLLTVNGWWSISNLPPNLGSVLKEIRKFVDIIRWQYMSC